MFSSNYSLLQMVGWLWYSPVKATRLIRERRQQQGTGEATKWLSIKMPHTNTRGAPFSSCAFIIGLLDSFVKAAEFSFPLQTEVTFIAYWATIVQLSIRSQLCLSYLEFKHREGRERERKLEKRTMQSRSTDVVQPGK